MLIVCPSCATSYEVEASTLQPSGRRVRCARCSNVWHAELPAAQKLLAAAAAIAPGHGPLEQALDDFAAEVVPPDVGDIEEDIQVAPIDQGLDPLPEEGAEIAVAADGIPGSETDIAAEVDAPPIAPADLDDGQAVIDAEAEPADETAEDQPEDIETYAARRERHVANRQAWRRWPLSSLQSGVLALILIDAILVSWRNDVVRIMPQTASFYSMLGLSVNVRGLVFTDVGTVTEQHEGVPVLVVEGNLINSSRKLADVPRLKFAVRNTSGEEVYSWTALPPRPSLPPGEAVAFRSRLASPPPEGHDVLVRFVTRNDVVPEGR